MRAARIGAAPAADNRGAAPIVCNPAARTSAVRRRAARAAAMHTGWDCTVALQADCGHPGIVRNQLGRIIRSVIVVLVGIVVAGIVVTHGSNIIP